MTERNELDILRMFAKRLARKIDIPHHNALDVIAKKYGHSHWNALLKAWEKGWCPEPWELIDINECGPTESTERGVGLVKTTRGVVLGEPYTLQIGFDDVLIGGDGWTIYLDHAPSKPATVETYTNSNPLDDKMFLSEVMRIAINADDVVREAIALD